MNNFYDKEGNPEYYKKYIHEHSDRIDWIIYHYSMKQLTGKLICDVGCGFGDFLNKLSDENFLVGIDGAEGVDKIKRKFKYYQFDLNLPFLPVMGLEKPFDIVTCFETLEHLPNLYNCVSEIKRIAKIDADIYLSIPHESVTHNTLYPALFYPKDNFEQFLAQMALPIVKKTYCPVSFPTFLYHCRNRPWSEKELKWTKGDERFKDMDVLGVINN